MNGHSRLNPPPDFRVLFESAPGLYLVLAPDLRIEAVSDAYLRATMTEREAIFGRPLFEVFPDNPDDTDATGVANLRASLDRVRTHRRPDAMAVQKYDIRRPDSEGGGFEERFWSPVNSPVLDANGRLLHIIHRVEDVTEFVRLKQLGAEQGKLADALRSESAQKEAEILRRGQELQEANRQLRALQAELEQRVVARTSDLQREVSDHERTVIALRDSEEQLRQSQKLEAIGRLAGGISHDFNNLLSVILSYSEAVLMDSSLSLDSRGNLLEVLQAGQRAADLTRQLLAFSRQQVLQPKVLDLNEVLLTLEKMLGRLLGEDIDLRLALAKPVGSVRADRSQLEQVVMNLAVNARDAMPSGGRLTLETANVDLDETYSTEHFDAVPGPYVMLCVSDTGIGMDKVTQARAFEPFFTTKERGKGTGLGLSTVFGIVRQSGGTIWLYSEPNHGTSFKIYLPRVPQPATMGPVSTVSPRPHGTETILLVEDDEQVRAVARSILESSGYRVLEARTAAEALQTANRAPAGIDLLLTDVVMPGRNGRQVAEELLAAHPGTRVLFMSGYTDDVVLHHGVLDSGVAFLQKPFTPDLLARKVRHVLDGPGTPR